MKTLDKLTIAELLTLGALTIDGEAVAGDTFFDFVEENKHRLDGFTYLIQARIEDDNLLIIETRGKNDN